MKLDHYQQQAQDFLERFNLRFSLAEYKAPMQTGPPWSIDDPFTADGKHGLRYRVTISRVDSVPLSFDFWGSLADRETLELHRANHPIDRRKVRAARPDPYTVLACISSDARCPDNFEEFCGDFGYETDSRKAEATWKRCLEFSRELQEFFRPEELEALAEIH